MTQELPNVAGPTQIEGYTVILDGDPPRFEFIDGEFQRVEGANYRGFQYPRWRAAPFELYLYRKNGSTTDFVGVMFRRCEPSWGEPEP